MWCVSFTRYRNANLQLHVWDTLSTDREVVSAKHNYVSCLEVIVSSLPVVTGLWDSFLNIWNQGQQQVDAKAEVLRW